MSPKAMSYNTDSVIYFKGDLSDKIFILKDGKVSLTYSDIESGQSVREFIQTGEFFGVKSALGKYPREETAVVLQNASVVMFTVPEFEQVAMQNTRIIMKMLQVFSTQLRKMHKRVQNQLGTDKQVSAETGLYGIGEYYFKKRQFPQAMYAFRRYLTYYPSGKFSDQAVKNLEAAEVFGKLPKDQARRVVPDIAPPESPPQGAAARPERGRELSDAAREYYNAVSIYSQQHYQEALTEFRKIVAGMDDAEYVAKAEYEIGRCLFATNQYDHCAKHFSSIIQKYPKHPDLADALFHIGQCYEKLSDMTRAQGIYRKIMTMTTEDNPLYRKARRAMMEGSKS